MDKNKSMIDKVITNFIEAVPYSSDKLDISDPTAFVYEILNTGITVYDKTSSH
ncbi:MAG: hypothetical protein KAX49_09920 [Halanaerobiales bacterium]|nr:hypothetical protein [Halanaerobiales bacterium]